ncbi:MAG: acetoacetate decarboxylase family protein [Bacteroidetes bacterium]|nr:acetoacetate decarboxylase family protein [Bacteroidota bacterium]
MLIDTKHYSGERKTVETSQGPVEFPIQYEKTNCFQAYFMVDFDRALSKLDGSGLVPARFINGKALAALAFFEYIETSIGAYNEVGLALAVLPENSAKPLIPAMDFIIKPGKRTVGFHILDLPVTTDMANSLGREVWGYPKFVTKIPLDFSKKFEGRVLDPDTDEEILALSADTDLGISLPGIDLTLYSNHEDSIVKTTVDVYAPMKTSIDVKARLRLGSSRHRMVKNFQDLDMDNSRPFIVQSTKSFQSFLNLGEKVASFKKAQMNYAEE